MEEREAGREGERQAVGGTDRARLRVEEGEGKNISSKEGKSNRKGNWEVRGKNM